MTVMSKNYVENNPHFSQAEIGAARKVFLAHSYNKQVHLLTIMDVEEAVAILQHCSITYVQDLISRLEKDGYDKLARHYAHQLGFIHSEVETAQSYLNTSALGHVQQRIG